MKVREKRVGVVQNRLAQAGRTIQLRAVEHLARRRRCGSRCRWCARRPPRRNSRARSRSGPSSCGSPRRRRSVRCSSMRSRTDSGFATWPVRLSAFSVSAGTFGGGGGGGVPSSTSITYLPRCTGDVRMAVEVSVRMLAWPSKPKRFDRSDCTRRKRLPRTFGNAVVLGQALIDERVVGGQQIEHVAVFAHDAVEEQFGLAPHGVGQRAVEIGKQEQIRLTSFRFCRCSHWPAKLVASASDADRPACAAPAFPAPPDLSACPGWRARSVDRRARCSTGNTTGARPVPDR